jgi:hypothetical protein
MPVQGRHDGGDAFSRFDTGFHASPNAASISLRSSSSVKCFSDIALVGH